MKIKFEFKWFDFWVGFYFDVKKRILFFCPIPMCVFSFDKIKKKKEKCYCEFCGKPLKEKLYVYKYDAKTGAPSLYKFVLECNNKSIYVFHDRYVIIGDGTLLNLNLRIGVYKYPANYFTLMNDSDNKYFSNVIKNEGSPESHE